jgi:hypothetical protein
MARNDAVDGNVLCDMATHKRRLAMVVVLAVSIIAVAGCGRRPQGVGPGTPAGSGVATLAKAPGVTPTSQVKPSVTTLPTRVSPTATRIPKDPTRKPSPTAQRTTEARVIDLTSEVEVSVNALGRFEFRLLVPLEYQETFAGSESLTPLQAVRESDFLMQYVVGRTLLPGKIDAKDTRYVVNGWVSHPSRFTKAGPDRVFVFDILPPP